LSYLRIALVRHIRRIGLPIGLRPSVVISKGQDESGYCVTNATECLHLLHSIYGSLRCSCHLSAAQTQLLQTTSCWSHCTQHWLPIQHRIHCNWLL